MSVDRAAQLLEAGIWLKLSGDREGARKLFERALKLDPTNQKAANLLAGGGAPGEEPAGAPVPPPPAIRSTQGAHPFERPDQQPAPWSAHSSGIIPEPSLDSDWGRLTGAKTPVPQPMPPVPAPLAAHPPGVNVVLGGTPAPESGPRPTLQLFGAPAPAVTHKTMQLFPPAQPPAGRSTLQLFGPAEEQPVPLPEPSTPPLFGYNPIDSPSPVTLGGMPTPSPSTPPLFASLPAAPPAPQAPMGNAWAWSSSPPPSSQELELDPYPEPRPSPSLAPRAESAWDQRSNPGIKLESVAGHDRALDLLSSDSKVTRSPEARQEEIRTILRGARDLLDLDDHSGAMELIVKAQQIAPDDPEVQAMRERSEKTLLNMFESKLGKLEAIPRVLLKDDEIIWLNLDHRAGFVLAQIDGTVTFDDLFSVSGMSRIDTARILAQLVEEGVISRG